MSEYKRIILGRVGNPNSQLKRGLVAAGAGYGIAAITSPEVGLVAVTIGTIALLAYAVMAAFNPPGPQTMQSSLKI